jgi:hypothetical protein
MVLNEIYWRWPEVNTRAIAEAFGYKPSDLRRLVKHHYSEEHPCLDCGVPLLITCRSKMVEIERVYKAKERGAGHMTGTQGARDAKRNDRKPGKQSGRLAHKGMPSGSANSPRCHTASTCKPQNGKRGGSDTCGLRAIDASFVTVPINRCMSITEPTRGGVTSGGPIS